MILTVTLNPAADKTIKVDHLSLGKTHEAHKLHMRAGGKGINVSEALVQFSVKTIATGFVGGSTGQFIKEDLTVKKVKHQFINIKDKTRTSLCMISLNPKQVTRILEDGPKISQKELRSFKRLYLKLLNISEYVVISGRNIKGADNSFCGDLVRLANKKNVKAVLDTSGDPLKRGLSSKPFLIKPNRQEAEYILKYSLNSQAKLKKCLDKFLNRGISNVIISLGEKGAVASDGTCFFWAKVPKTAHLHAVGCGDALIAGFLYARTKGKDFKNSLKWAVAAGTANLSQEATCEFSLKQVNNILKQVKIRNIK